MTQNKHTDDQTALRERQGKGARYDSPAAPAHELMLARLGTAYFARLLNGIKDEDLDVASLIPGWTRRHVVVYIAYQARQLALMIEAIHNGSPVPVFDTQTMSKLIEDGATLPARALRNLFDHAEVHLNVVWRDLSADNWAAAVMLDGTQVGIRETPWIRARAVWVHAVDLASEGSFLDFPSSLLEALLNDLGKTAPFEKHSLERKSNDCWIIRPDREQEPIFAHPADAVRWLSGRGARRLTGLPRNDATFEIPLWPQIFAASA
ncbi:maleylpyruvate isomerase family mycothiol-dependent enzyme [Agrobacterium tumefaciens]|uniref:maleylpyruvate isomerase family mycothiol-dependent enzyme n=1 Tax=Agrobacterium tumefaciens TaxID=358 RepID=UPI003BA146A1